MSEGQSDRLGLLHRQIPPMIGAPAIVRHEAIWMPTSSPQFRLGKLPRISEVVEKGSSSPLLKGANEAGHDRLRYAYFEWNGFRCLIRIRLHTEYLAFTTSISCSREPAAEPDAAIREQIETAFGDPSSNLDLLLGGVTSQASSTPFLSLFDQEIGYCDLVTGFWRHFKGDTASDDNEVTGSDNSRQKVEQARYLDIRMLITAEAPDQSAVRGSEGQKGKIFSKPFSQPGIPKREFAAEAQIKESIFPKPFRKDKASQLSDGRVDWYLSSLRSYEAAIGLDRSLAKEAPDAVELTASGLLGGRALLLTHLGPQANAQIPCPPMRMFLHCRRNDEWQVGRLVDRLLAMATACASLEKHAEHVLGKRNDLRLLIRTFERSRDGLNHISTLINRTISGDDVDGEFEKINADNQHLTSADPVLRERVVRAGTDNRVAGKALLLSPSEMQNGWNSFHIFVHDEVGGEKRKKPSSALWDATDLRIRTLTPKAGSAEFIRLISHASLRLERFCQIVLEHGGHDYTEKARAFVQRHSLFGQPARAEPADEHAGFIPGFSGPGNAASIHQDDLMEYRTERAIYYAERFNKLTEQLRVERVEGFQTYNEFVQRRMIDAMSFVHNAREYLREIAEQRARMSDQIVNMTQIIEAHESDEQEKKIVEIQDFAEFALLSFLLPYYFGYIIKTMWEKTCGSTGWVFPVLIITFTLVNFAKRTLQGKWTELWHELKSTKKGYIRKIGIGLVSVEVLSIAAIVIAGTLWLRYENAERQPDDPPGCEVVDHRAPHSLTPPPAAPPRPGPR